MDDMKQLCELYCKVELEESKKTIYSIHHYWVKLVKILG